jgi:hypothetical protein
MRRLLILAALVFALDSHAEEMFVLLVPSFACRDVEITASTASCDTSSGRECNHIDALIDPSRVSQRLRHASPTPQVELAWL